VGRLYPGIQRASNETFGGEAPENKEEGEAGWTLILPEFCNFSFSCRVLSVQLIKLP